MKDLKRLLFKLLFTTSILIALSACSSTPEQKVQEPIIIEETAPIEKKRFIPLPEDPLHTYIDDLSTDQLISQLFIVRMDQLNKAPGIQVGGVIFFADDIDSVSSLKAKIINLQANKRIPLFTAIDEEGGTVSRLKPFFPEVLSKSPSSFKTQKPEEIKRHAEEIAAILKTIGLNVNFAPVVDVLDQADNSLLRYRSFGDNPHKVDSMASAFLSGLENRQVMGVYKHFPGHGAVNADSHYGEAVITIPFEEFKSRHLLPYTERPIMLNGIMVAHITLPEISELPATLSPEISDNLLRRQLGYLGLVFTDALNMGAITQYYDSGTAAVKALQAGADILLIPEDFPQAFQAVKAAVNSGIIDRSRLEESVYRILYAKQLYCGLELY